MQETSVESKDGSQLKFPMAENVSRSSSDTSSKASRRQHRRKTLGDVLGTFASYTSLQGVPYIQKANRWWSSGFWVVVFMAGCGALAFHAFYLIQQLRKWEFTTVVTLGYDNLPFPSVTICNYNPIVKNKLSETSQNMRDYVDRIKPPAKDEVRGPSPGPASSTASPLPSQMFDNSNSNRTKRQAKRTSPAGGFGRPKPQGSLKLTLSEDESPDLTNLNDFLELYANLTVQTRRDVGQRADVFIQECSFNGFSCSYRDFEHHLSPLYGNCWTFNGASRENASASRIPLTSFLPGKDYGMNLRLYIEGDQYIPGVAQDVGVIITIHDYDTMTFPEQNGISVGAGMTTLIGMKMINVTRAGHPYSQCEPGTAFEREFDATYTRQACMATCSHKFISHRCGCYLAPYEYYYSRRSLNNLTKCSEAEDRCVAETMSNIANGTLHCTHCLPACHEKNFDKQLSSTRWPEPSYMYAIVEKACEIDTRYCDRLLDNAKEEIPKNFVNLKIFYRELNFENLVEQPAYQLVQFVSDLGGVMGLWIGISALSLVEILQFVLELLKWMCKSKCGST